MARNPIEKNMEEDKEIGPENNPNQKAQEDPYSTDSTEGAQAEMIIEI